MVQKFEEKKFNIGKLKGISEKNIEEHLKLYAGYVKNINLLLEQADNGRIGFEYNGMRNHEIYFASLSDGVKSLEKNSKLKNKITEEFGSYDKWLAEFKSIAMTRGVGWAILYLDRKEHRLLNAWVDEQHIGQLQDCSPIIALDMWEHAFVADYEPSGKKQYTEDFFANLNWQVIEQNFSSAS